jgi:hypothetical protein
MIVNKRDLLNLIEAFDDGVELNVTIGVHAGAGWALTPERQHEVMSQGPVVIEHGGAGGHEQSINPGLTTGTVSASRMLKEFANGRCLDDLAAELQISVMVVSSVIRWYLARPARIPWTKA